MPNRLLQVHRPREVGDRFEYMSLTFWAEHGYIAVHDSEPDGPDDELVTITRREWLARTAGFANEAARLGDMAVRAGNIALKARHVEERETTLALVEAMLIVAKRAKAQGDPTDPKVQAYFRKHHAKRQNRILVPGIAKERAAGKLIVP